MSIEDAKEIIAKSGVNLQCKVANYFRARKWAVLLSPYYVDRSTDKSRETDLIAAMRFPVPNFFRGPPRAIEVRFSIECKYISQNTVFWFDQRDDVSTWTWISNNTHLPKDNHYAKSHHYLKSNAVAKLFATASQKGEETEPMFRALNQCLSAYVNLRNRGSIVRSTMKEEIFYLSYPLIVCSDFSKFFRTAVEGDAAPTPLSESFQFEVDYAYIDHRDGHPRSEYFLVDVVDFSRVDTFMQTIETEVKAAVELARND